MSQTQQILDYLKRGRSVDPQVALRLFGSFRLAARVAELRERGIAIKRELVKSREGKRYARYFL